MDVQVSSLRVPCAVCRVLCSRWKSGVQRTCCCGWRWHVWVGTGSCSGPHRRAKRLRWASLGWLAQVALMVSSSHPWQMLFFNGFLSLPYPSPYTLIHIHSIFFSLQQIKSSFSSCPAQKPLHQLPSSKRNPSPPVALTPKKFISLHTLQSVLSISRVNFCILTFHGYSRTLLFSN